MINIESLELYTIIDGKHIKINEHLLKKFNQVVEKINDELVEEKQTIKVLYRGDELSKVKRKLNTDTLNFTLEKIFRLGEKANSLFMTSNQNNANIFRIDNVENDVFEDIFNKINTILNAEKKSPKLCKFILNNDEFVKYFSNTRNISDFIQKIQSSNKKLFLKDYYMAFLHTEGKIIGNESYFLSTSENLKIAERFASNNGPANGLVFCYYINKPFISYGIFSKNKGYLKKEIKASNLPFYSPLHVKEEEFSVRGGLLPHYILYVKYYQGRKEKFFINPFIFVDDYNIQDDINDGFPVDQENFIKEIKETNYTGYFVETDNEMRQYTTND